MNIIVAGSTGLCGSAFLKRALESSAVSRVTSFSRREPKVPGSEKLTVVADPDSKQWPEKFPQSADLFFSGIATTRAAAGGLDKQRAIDFDLQVELATAAHSKGCKTFVLVSSAGASSSSMMGYMKMKGEIEEAVVKIGFERTIILRPGPLLGEREKVHTGFGSGMISCLSWVHRSPVQSLVGYPIYGDEIARAVLSLAQSLPKGVHYVSSKELLDAAQ